MTMDAAAWQAHRRCLFAVAYRLLGSVSEAEDAVQETYLRLHHATPASWHGLAGVGREQVDELAEATGEALDGRGLTREELQAAPDTPAPSTGEVRAWPAPTASRPRPGRLRPYVGELGASRIHPDQRCCPGRL